MAAKERHLRTVVEKEAYLWGDNVAVAYHQKAANDMDRQWKIFIEPIIEKYPIDYANVIDFAAGFGRNAARLLRNGSGHVTAVDVNADCIRAIESAFPPEKVTAILNNGFDLDGLEDNCYTFLYTFDAMVHFDLEIVASYVPEFYRVLKPGAYAFIHHSNFSDKPGNDFTRNGPHWRNFMSADVFRHIAMHSGFVVEEQALMSWGAAENVDCRTILRKPT